MLFRSRARARVLPGRRDRRGAACRAGQLDTSRKSKASPSRHLRRSEENALLGSARIRAVVESSGSRRARRGKAPGPHHPQGWGRSRSTRGRGGRPILRRSRGDDRGVGTCCPRASDLPKEIERPRAWAPPARRSENDFALERGETFMDRWLRLRAADLGDEVWDRRHARGARGSVETLQKLVYVACAMTRLVRARATPRADSSASMRDVGRVEDVRSRPSEHDRFTRLAHDRLAALADRRARGSSRSLAARAKQRRQRHAVRRARGANAARAIDGTPKRAAGVNRQRPSRVGNAARSGPNEGDSSLK